MVMALGLAAIAVTMRSSSCCTLNRYDGSRSGASVWGRGNEARGWLRTWGRCRFEGVLSFHRCLSMVVEYWGSSFCRPTKRSIVYAVRYREEVFHFSGMLNGCEGLVRPGCWSSVSNLTETQMGGLRVEPGRSVWVGPFKRATDHVPAWMSRINGSWCLPLHSGVLGFTQEVRPNAV